MHIQGEPIITTGFSPAGEVQIARELGLTRIDGHLGVWPRREQLAGRNRPQPGGLIFGAGGERNAIRTEGDGADEVGVGASQSCLRV